MTETTAPRFHRWIVPGRLAVAERLGGGGSSHRRELREAEQTWWRAQGGTAIVSGMKTRHNLVEYALDDFTIRWHPLADPEQARDALPRLVAAALALVERDAGAVLVHCDRAGEWLTAIDAGLRLGLRLARSPEEALAQAEADGLPVGSLATSVVGAPAPAAA
jgi:hypothetical protein